VDRKERADLDPKKHNSANNQGNAKPVRWMNRKAGRLSRSRRLLHMVLQITQGIAGSLPALAISPAELIRPASDADDAMGIAP
jgi:hypothetical protein